MSELPEPFSISPDPSYIEEINGGLRIRETRISLDSVVIAHLRGQSPEGIQDAFPLLSLEQIHGALAFYLRNREEVDAYLEEGREEYRRQYEKARAEDPEFYDRIEGVVGRKSA